MRLVMPGCVHDLRSMPSVRVLILAICMGLYLTTGASVFQAIEEPLELKLKQKMNLLKANFLSDHPSVTG